MAQGGQVTEKAIRTLVAQFEELSPGFKKLTSEVDKEQGVFHDFGRWMNKNILKTGYGD